MAEVIREFATQLRGNDGRSYAVQATGRERADGLWEGWLEFLPIGDGEPVSTARETTQPNRKDLLYWAGGLTDPYLDGALARALTPQKKAAPREPGIPVWSDPKPHTVPSGTAAQHAVAVLDPFHVYAAGDDVLRGQLRALSAAQLRNIVRAHQLADIRLHELERTMKPDLITMIMAGVERRISA
jgi:hypothetical protein